jgi:hypothetical protein
MIYVFDTSSLSNVLKHYYRDSFPSFWEKFDEATLACRVISVRESKLELEEKFCEKVIEQLVKHNSDFFANPRNEELAFITEIYSIPHFRQNLERKKLLKGGPFADPFIIAKAKILNGTVVTEEELRDNGAKIPNICEHFGIECVSLEGFLLGEDWKF